MVLTLKWCTAAGIDAESGAAGWALVRRHVARLKAARRGVRQSAWARCISNKQRDRERSLDKLTRTGVRTELMKSLWVLLKTDWFGVKANTESKNPWSCDTEQCKEDKAERKRARQRKWLYVRVWQKNILYLDVFIEALLHLKTLEGHACNMVLAGRERSTCH